MTERTGWPPGLLQDDCRKLARWFSSRLDARECVRRVAAENAAHREWAELMRAKIKACNEHDAKSLTERRLASIAHQ